LDIDLSNRQSYAGDYLCPHRQSCGPVWIRPSGQLRGIWGLSLYYCLKGNPREDSDIDLVVVSNNFKDMNIRERLELLGIAAGKVFEPIEAIGYTPDEMESNKKGTFLEVILEQART
jgi:hypothetical protein